MKDIINLEINNFEPITHARINIGELNVIGGLNGTGKSTASKLLYCFLKSVSSKRQIFYLEQNLGKINSTIRELNRCSDLFEYKRLHMQSGFDYILDEFYDYYAVYKTNFEEFKNDHVLVRNMEELWDAMNMILDNGDELYESVFQNLLNSEFSSDLSGHVVFSGNALQSFEYILNLKNSIWEDNAFINFGRFNVDDVFYIDSISNLDLSRIRVRPPEHIDYLKKSIRWNEDNSENLSSKDNQAVYELERRIMKIINGQFNPRNLKFSQGGKEISVINTSSGTKQIGVIQLLLSNRKLREGTFLIIDEPEVNLHPEWQIKLAEVLVLLVKELHIIVYINTHSPMFIEAMSLYSEYYELLDSTNFYLTVNKNDAITFNKIDPKDMGAVYENLSRPYDDLDEIKSKILFR